VPPLACIGHDELLAVPVDADINLVDFDLPHVLYEGLQMVLQGVGGDTEKDVDQPVIANFGEQRLLVCKRIGGDDFGRGIRYLDSD